MDLEELAPLLVALARGSGMDVEDLRQGVWLGVLERAAERGLPADRRSWLRGLAVRQVIQARRPEVPVARVVVGVGVEPERLVLAAELRRVVGRALAESPGRCPALLALLAGSPELSYRQVADELGVPRGSIGPIRSRCLGRLRAPLAAWRGP